MDIPLGIARCNIPLSLLAFLFVPMVCERRGVREGAKWLDSKFA